MKGRFGVVTRCSSASSAASQLAQEWVAARAQEEAVFGVPHGGGLSSASMVACRSARVIRSSRRPRLARMMSLRATARRLSGACSGTRQMATYRCSVEPSSSRALLSRARQAARTLPPGTLLDGEIIVANECGHADFWCPATAPDDRKTNRGTSITTTARRPSGLRCARAGRSTSYRAAVAQ
jgi:hypothetical protein